MADGVISKIKLPDNTEYDIKDTKNTAGSTDTSSKIFLIGATSQAVNPQTYSDNQVYTTSGTLTSNKLSTKAIVAMTGSGTAGSDKGSGVSPRYIPSLWTFNSGITVANGEIYFIKIPVAGGTYGVWLSLNNGTNYYPVTVSSGKGRFTTHYGVNTVIAVTYESAGTCTCYPKGGGDSTSDVTGIFRVLNDYDANTTYNAMSSSELTTGTTTTSRVVRSDYLKSGINSLIDTKINALDVSSVGGSGKYITTISETNGKISASAGTADTTVTKSSSNLVTSGAVWTAIDSLPEPMVFKGSLGTDGTITALPADGSAKVGDTYKVITAGTYASQAAKIGDTFICDSKTSTANTWTLIPSGDEPSGTVTSVKIEATSPIVVSSSSAITTSGTRTISHANSGATAGSYGDSAAQTPAYGGTFKVPYVTVNATGHVTGISEHTVKIPASDNTDTKVTSVGNHYTPAADTTAELSADASSTTAATWDSTSLVTGINIQRDAKGHAVGVTVDSIKMPANPNIWTAFSGASATADGTAGYVPAPGKGNQAKFFKADGTWAVPTNTTYTASTTSIGSASAGTAIAADDITGWTQNTPTSCSISKGVLTFTAGTKASLSYTARSIPNISVASKTVVTGITAN